MRKITLIMALFLSTFVLAKEEIWLSQWEAKEGRDNIAVECRTHITNIDQCRYRVTVDASIEALTAVQKDYQNYKNWFANVTESRVLLSGVVYLRFNFQGVVADRYTIVRSEISQDPATKAVMHTFEKAKTEYKEPDLRLVEYPVMVGYFKFTPTPDGKTEIEYTNLSPPGEQVQKYLYMLYNIENLKAGFNSILGMVREASKHNA